MSRNLAVLTVGMGSLATTLFAGVEAQKKGIAQPFSRLKPTQMTALERMRFGGWDLFPETAYHSALHAGVLPVDVIEELRMELFRITPMPAVFDRKYVSRLESPYTKSGETRWDLAEQVRADIRRFMSDHACDRAVVLGCATAESGVEASFVHETLSSFEWGMRKNHESISPFQIYAYAALKERAAFVSLSPVASYPFLTELAQEMGVPLTVARLKSVEEEANEMIRALEARAGWLGKPVRAQLTLSCSDSMLWAPQLLDCVHLADLAMSYRLRGEQRLDDLNSLMVSVPPPFGLTRAPHADSPALHA